jgi:RNA polymerase sigma-70 factor (ECF subfamily)
VKRESRPDPSFDAIFACEYASVFHAATLVVGDAEVAAEVTQEAFTKLFVHWRKVSGYERPGAWVRRVAIHDAMRVARRDERRGRAGVRYLQDPTRVDPPAGNERSEQLAAALGELSPQQRATVVLFYLDGLSVAEVAEAIGTSPSTVKVHLHRARRQLGARLDEEVGDVIG